MRVDLETLGQQGWPGGVVPGTDATLLGPTTSPRGRNSALSHGYTGVPYPQKRMGMSIVNASGLTGHGAILGQETYYRVSTGVTKQVIVDDTGLITLMATDGTMSELSAALTAGTHYPDFATVNDSFFIVNGTDAKKIVGSTIETFGITRPTVGTLAGAAGAAGSPNGTYELRVTYANSTTGMESSASDTASATVVVANQKISVTNVPVSGDTQVDIRYLYVRNVDTMQFFYRAGTISDNSTTTITLDFLDENIVTEAPTTTSHNPPTSGIKYLALHQGRLFAATDGALYYSQVDAPEAFDPLNIEYVGRSDGQPIRGIVSDQEILLILKEDKVYGLYGNNPATWEIRLVSNGFGCGSHRTIVAAFQKTYWWGRTGLVQWSGTESPEPIGLKLYGDPADRVDYSSIDTASAALDAARARLLVAVPETGQSEATLILPFNLLLSVFESDGWDPMRVGALGSGVDANSSPQAYLGNLNGQMFTLWSSNSDGMASSTTSTGTFVASGASVTTVTDLTATFDTTGEGLIERRVTILTADGDEVTGSIRPYIVSNNATSFTLVSAVGGLVDGATYTYIVGGPNFAWDTPWRTFDAPWTKKRFEYLWMLLKGVGGTHTKIEVAFDWDDNNAAAFDAEISQGLSLWDDPNAIWDLSVWDGPSSAGERFRVGRVGRAYRIRLRNAYANEPLALLYFGMQGVFETVKR